MLALAELAETDADEADGFLSCAGFGDETCEGVEDFVVAAGGVG